MLMDISMNTNICMDMDTNENWEKGMVAIKRRWQSLYSIVKKNDTILLANDVNDKATTSFFIPRCCLDLIMSTLSMYDGMLNQTSEGVFNILFSTKDGADRYLEETLQPTAVLKVLQDNGR